jgi:general secretion pathway protein B
MSFILDALKKSETDRQQQTPAAFATVPSSAGRSLAPRWLILLGALLVINVIVLLVLLLRPVDDTPAAAVNNVAAVETTPPAATTDFAAQIEAARRNEPQRRAPPSSAQVRAIPGAPDTSANTSATRPATNPPKQPAASVPTIYELQAKGSITLPELHLDIHVYSEVPEDRFVFINMSKQREKSQLSEGPMVDEITPDGVVLEYRGTTFLLPRD